MAYNKMDENPGPAAEGGGDGEVFYLPEDYQGNCKVGDIIKLEVLAVPKDGPPEVRVISEGAPKEEMGMMDDLRSTMAESGPSEQY